MTKSSDPIVEKYLESVSDKLVCRKSEKKVFMRQFRELVLSYADEKRGVALEDLYGEFGDPDVFSEQFTERADYAALLKKAEQRVLLWKILAIVGILLIMSLIVFIIYQINHHGTVTVSNIHDVYRI